MQTAPCGGRLPPDGASAHATTTPELHDAKVQKRDPERHHWQMELCLLGIGQHVYLQVQEHRHSCDVEANKDKQTAGNDAVFDWQAPCRPSDQNNQSAAACLVWYSAAADDRSL